MSVRFYVYLEGENGRHIEMPIIGYTLEEVDNIIASKYENYQSLRKEINTYNNKREYSTQYPRIKKVAINGKRQTTESYTPIYGILNKDRIRELIDDILNSNLKEKYPKDFPKQNIAKDIVYMLSKEKNNISYEIIREIYFKLKKLGELNLTITTEEYRNKINSQYDKEIYFKQEHNLSDYLNVIDNFKNKNLICTNPSEFPYVHYLIEKLEESIHKSNLAMEDIKIADSLVDEIMSFCYKRVDSIKRKKYNKT